MCYFFSSFLDEHIEKRKNIDKRDGKYERKGRKKSPFIDLSLFKHNE
jgi:hypothetical protein